MFIPLTFRKAAEVEKAEARVGMGRDGWGVVVLPFGSR